MQNFPFKGSIQTSLPNRSVFPEWSDPQDQRLDHSMVSTGFQKKKIQALFKDFFKDIFAVFKDIFSVVPGVSQLRNTEQLNKTLNFHVIFHQVTVT